MEAGSCVCTLHHPPGPRPGTARPAGTPAVSAHHEDPAGTPTLNPPESSVSISGIITREARGPGGWPGAGQTMRLEAAWHTSIWSTRWTQARSPSLFSEMHLSLISSQLPRGHQGLSLGVGALDLAFPAMSVFTKSKA